MQAFDDERDISVSLDGWDFNDYHGSTHWVLSLSGVKGLWDGRASNLSTSQLAMIDGVSWNVPRYGGKTVDLSGYILGSSTAGILAAWKSFTSFSSARVNTTVGATLFLTPSANVPGITSPFVSRIVMLFAFAVASAIVVAVVAANVIVSLSLACAALVTVIVLA